MLSQTVVATVFAVIFLAELPDKSLFASLVLGTRYRPLWVWAGVSAAFVVHVVIAVAAGGIVTLLPRGAVEIVVGILFAVGAYLMLRPEAARDDEAEAEQESHGLLHGAGAGSGARKVIGTSFAVVFVGEWGDITQIATANFAAKYQEPLSVALGAGLALIAVAGLAVKVGSSLLRRVPLTWVRRTAGLILAVFAVGTLLQLVG